MAPAWVAAHDGVVAHLVVVVLVVHLPPLAGASLGRGNVVVRVVVVFNHALLVRARHVAAGVLIPQEDRVDDVLLDTTLGMLIRNYPGDNSY